MRGCASWMHSATGRSGPRPPWSGRRGCRRRWSRGWGGAKAALGGARGGSPWVIEGRERAGAIERLEMPRPPVVLRPDVDAAPPVLSPEQAGALEQIRTIGVEHFGVALLDGVTGGGKTEVFFEAAADTLRAGRQVLILLPEIALTHAFLDRFEKRFGARPAEWHSEMTPVQRARVWRGVNDGSVRAVVGARS